MIETHPTKAASTKAARAAAPSGVEPLLLDLPGAFSNAAIPRGK